MCPCERLFVVVVTTVVVADDFQWLDGATSSVLSFVARRLESTHILLIAGLRETDHLANQQAPALAGHPSAPPDSSSLQNLSTLVTVF
jgi:hypothetical protein